MGFYMILPTSTFCRLLYSKIKRIFSNRGHQIWASCRRTPRWRDRRNLGYNLEHIIICIYTYTVYIQYIYCIYCIYIYTYLRCCIIIYIYNIFRSSWVSRINGFSTSFEVLYNLIWMFINPRMKNVIRKLMGLSHFLLDKLKKHQDVASDLR